MGILDKLIHRKREPAFEKPSYKPMASDEIGLPELDAGSPTDVDDSEPSYPSDYSQSSPLSRGFQGRNLLKQDAFGSGNSRDIGRDFDLIISKLDAIRSILSNLDIRISNLERAAGINNNSAGQGYPSNQSRYKW